MKITKNLAKAIQKEVAIGLRDNVIFELVDGPTPRKDDLLVIVHKRPNEKIKIIDKPQSRVKVQEEKIVGKDLRTDVVMKRRYAKSDIVEGKTIYGIVDEKEDPITKETLYLVRGRMGTQCTTWVPEGALNAPNQIKKYKKKKKKANFLRTYQDDGQHPLVSELADHVLSSIAYRPEGFLFRPILTMDTLPHSVHQSLINQHAHRILDYRNKIGQESIDEITDTCENRYFSKEIQHSFITELQKHKSKEQQPLNTPIDQETEKFKQYINSQQLKELHDVDGLISVEY